MTKAQKKIILEGFVAYAFMIFIIVSFDWLLMHWNKLMWPLFVIIQIMIFFNKNQPHISPEERSKRYNKITQQNPWIVIFLMIYVILVFIMLFSAMLYNIHFDEIIGFGGVLGMIFLLVLPFMLTDAKEKYLRAGEVGND